MPVVAQPVPIANPIILPRDIWVKIISDYFGLPEHRILSLSTKAFRALTKDNAIWKKRFECHFPERYAELEKKQNVDWYAEFIAATLADYKNLPKPIQQLFYIAKEGNTHYLSLKDPIILEQLLSFYDAKNLSPVEWLLRNKQQPMLDAIFKFVLKCFEINPRNSTLKKYFKEEQGWTSAHWAVLCNQPEHVLSQHLGEQDFSNTAMTPFHVAAQYGLVEALKFLLPKFQIDHRTILTGKGGIKKNRTALHLAARRGHLDCVTFLVDKEADCSATVTADQGFDHMVNALHYAARGNYVGVAEYLCAKISPLSYRWKDSKTPLTYTILNSNQELFDHFIEKIKAMNPPIPRVEAILNPILQVAAESGNNHFIKSLLELGADPNWANLSKDFVTAFDIVMNRHDSKSMKLLLGDTPVAQVNYKAPQQPIRYILIPAFILTPLTGLWIFVYAKFFENGNDAQRLIFIFGTLAVVGAFIVFGGCLIEKRLRNNREEQVLNFMRQTVDDDTPATELRTIDDSNGVMYHSLPQAPSSFSEQYKAVGFLGNSHEQDLERGEEEHLPSDDYEMKRISVHRKSS